MPLSDLATLKNGIKNRRFSSYDRTGGNFDFIWIHAGQSVEIAAMDGPGCIKHIWMTTYPICLKALILRAFWDGEETPSIQCPVGDFFGLGHSHGVLMSSVPIQTFDMGMNCYFPMPFASGMRITITNESPDEQYLYYNLDVEQHDFAQENTARFHANFRRELVVKKPCLIGPNRAGSEERLNITGDDNYVILQAQGKGHYVGCFVHLDTNETGWWGEGDEMIFIDGESWPPEIHGTGMEDYFLSAWNYAHVKSAFCTPFFGYSVKGNDDYTGQHSQYRFHIEDPIYFEKDIRVTVEHGHSNDRQGDWISTAYWYQIGRTQPLPEIPPYEERLPYSSEKSFWPTWKTRDRSVLPSDEVAPE